MQYLLMGLLVGAIVAADQWTKALTVANIPVNGNVDVIPGLFHFTHVHNYGAAWSSFQGMIWLFALIFAVFTVWILWDFSKNRTPFTTLERWLLVAAYGGGLGNMIDRLRLGYVVDMIEVDFMRFPVFNVADIFISCGFILLMLHLIFFNKEFWKDEKK